MTHPSVEGGGMRPDRSGAERSSLLQRAGRLALRPHARELLFHDWYRALAGEPRLPGGAISAVAVVCKGNLCRSPLAAALLARAVPALRVDSFGLAAAAGQAAHPNACRIASERGLDLSAHRTRALATPHVEAADLILAMEAPQAREIARRWPGARARVRLLGDFLPERPFAIADPWSRSDAVWRETDARLGRAVERLADRLVAAR